MNISAFFKGNRKVPVIYPFARYEYYNPQEKGDTSQIMEKRCQVSMWTAGLNWYALPNLVVKADYTTRQIGTNKVLELASIIVKMSFRLVLPISVGLSRSR